MGYQTALAKNSVYCCTLASKVLGTLAAHFLTCCSHCVASASNAITCGCSQHWRSLLDHPSLAALADSTFPCSSSLSSTQTGLLAVHPGRSHLWLSYSYLKIKAVQLLHLFPDRCTASTQPQTEGWQQIALGFPCIKFEIIRIQSHSAYSLTC